MRVKCINIFNQFTKKFVSTSNSLTIGKEYLVIALEINSEKRLFYRILNDDPRGDSALYESSQFKIVSDIIPSNWRVTQHEAGTITFSPSAWRVLGFWEDFYEYNPEAKKIYDKELKIILDEEKK